MHKNNPNNSICNNCGKDGHVFYQCKLPLISCGIILFKYTDNKIKYLMIRRKNSYGYIDLIRGKYNQHNNDQILSLINQMSLEEKNKLLNNSFKELWEDIWWNTLKFQYNNEYVTSNNKFEYLRKSKLLNELINTCIECWEETEWEFPKGRRNNTKEIDIECALREFQEETGIHPKNIKIVENIVTFDETFIGTNYKCYKNKYFIAGLIDKNISITLTNFQESEVSKISWKTCDECIECIRPLNLEKKNVIKNINNVLQQYRLYL